MSNHDSFGPYCPICGAEMQRETCWECHGEGGWHDCGEDCCPCLDKEEITERCETCNGKGSYWECPAVPHTDAQIAKYNETVLRDMPK